MKRTIWLRDLAHVPTPRHNEYSRDLMERARAAQVARGLRFDNATGKLFDNRDGEIERFVNPSDHVPAADVQEVMEWQFSRYIANSASRMSRGYEP